MPFCISTSSHFKCKASLFLQPVKIKEEIISLINLFIAKGLSKAYANRLVVITKVMFNKALDWELVNEETVKKLKRCKVLKGEVKRLRYLSEDEADRLILNSGPYLKPIIFNGIKHRHAKIGNA